MTGLRAILLSGICALSAGCAEFTHLTRTTGNLAFESSRTSFIDAKQRAVTTVKRTNGDKVTQIMTCAEPSPDALSSIAASQGFDLSKDDIQAAYSMALAESAGSIGLRTQSIQLMRDAMYRLCEGAQSGYIGPLAFETLYRRYQTSMVAILAIEQLTGTVKAPPIILTGDAKAGSAELAAKYTELASQWRAKVKTAEQNEKDAATALKDAQTARQKKLDELLKQFSKTKEEELSDEQKKPLEPLTADVTKKETAHKDAETAVKEAKEALEAADQARRAALSGGGAASTRGEIGSAGSPPVDKEAIKVVADKVADIAKTSMGQGFLNETCATFLANLATNLAKPSYTVGNVETENPLVQRCKADFDLQLQEYRLKELQLEDERRELLKKLGLPLTP